nr:putative ribonuclease H-like domain-containing protein [Tanacetum cinerariifolium]
MDSLSLQAVAAAKLPILNPNEFDLWKMRIEQYFLMTDYSLLEVILNGDSPTPTRCVDGFVQVIAPTTADVSAASTKAPVSILPNVDNLSDDVIYSFFASQSNNSQLDNEDLKQINADDLEEMDLKWQMVMLTIRARRLLQRTGKNLGANGTTTIGDDVSKVECYNFHRRGHFARECRSPRDSKNKDTQRRTVLVETSTSNALVSQCDGVGSYEELTNYSLMAFTSSSSSSSSSSNNKVAPYSKACSKAYATLQSHYDKLTVDFRKSQFDVFSYKSELKKKFKKAKKERDELKHTLKKFQTSLKNLSKLLESQITNKTSLRYDNQVFNSHVLDCDELSSSESDDSVPTSPMNDRYKSGEGYHVVPHRYTRTFMPPKPDLVFHYAPTASETVPNVFNVDPSTTKPTEDMAIHSKLSKIKVLLIGQSPRHMTGNISYLSDFKEINRGYVAFGRNLKGGKITGQDTECVILSSDFKLPNENHMLLRVPRENNMYNVDLKNVVPLGDLTYLFEKATLDETPSIEFMRPFGCPVTILNTLDTLGKFDGKANEGFLVGYSVNSKAFIVFNSRTKIVQETLHINFLENQPNAKRKAKGKSPIDISTGVRDLRDEFEDFSSNSINRVNTASAPVTAVRPNPTNSTNNFNVVGPSDNVVSLNFEIGGKSLFVDHSQYHDDPDMPSLEDIVYSDDEEDVGAEADFSNLETNISVSPIPTNRVHKDHPVTQIIAYASFMGFMVYQMDVKSPFLYGTIEEEVYVCQPPGFKDPDYPDKVYKVVKALYGLHQAPKAWYETLANYLLENGFQRGKIDQTLFIKKQKG